MRKITFLVASFLFMLNAATAQEIRTDRRGNGNGHSNGNGQHNGQEKGGGFAKGAQDECSGSDSAAGEKA